MPRDGGGADADAGPAQEDEGPAVAVLVTDADSPTAEQVVLQLILARSAALLAFPNQTYNRTIDTYRIPLHGM
jgi:hypothetical protein